MKDRVLALIQAQYNIDQKIPPVIALDDYFTGNSDEECIAPNQVGEGRPSLEEFYAQLQEIQRKPNVQAVLVGIHFDWAEARKYDDDWPAAENIHIYTSASWEEVERWVAGLAADGVGEGWPYGMHPSAPPIKDGFNVITVFWD